MADRYMVLVLGGLMVMVGLAFKLSAVPFHFSPRYLGREAELRREFADAWLQPKNGACA